MRTQQEKILKMLGDVVEQAELEPVRDFDHTNAGVIYVQDPDSLTIFAMICLNFQNGSVNIRAKVASGNLTPQGGTDCLYINSATFSTFLDGLSEVLAKELSPLSDIRR